MCLSSFVTDDEKKQFETQKIHGATIRILCAQNQHLDAHRHVLISRSKFFGLLILGQGPVNELNLSTYSLQVVEQILRLFYGLEANPTLSDSLQIVQVFLDGAQVCPWHRKIIQLQFENISQKMGSIEGSNRRVELSIALYRSHAEKNLVEKCLQGVAKETFKDSVHRLVTPNNPEAEFVNSCLNGSAEFVRAELRKTSAMVYKIIYEDPAKKRWNSMEICSRVLVHASKCKDDLCDVDACPQMKAVLSHYKECPTMRKPKCSTCQKFVALCVFNARKTATLKRLQK